MSLELDPSQNQNRRLDQCPHCESGLLQADEFEKVADEVWFGFMECPECDWSKTVVLDRDGIDELDELLDERDRELDEARKGLEAEHMRETLGVFTAAIAADQIFPEDFA